MSIFSERLKELRKENNLTIVDLAEKIGFSKSIISYWENGKKEPTLSAIESLSYFFGVDSDYLIGLSDRNEYSENYNYEEKKLILDYRGLSRPLKDILQGLIKTWQTATSEATNKKNV